MKRLLLFLCIILYCTILWADTITLNWYINENTPIQTTCNIGEDVLIPTTPQKKGHSFQGWISLPYVPLEYIESTGEQLIQSGVSATKDLSVEIIYENINGVSFGSYITGGGGIYEIGQGPYCVYNNDPNPIYFCYGLGNCKTQISCTEITSIPHLNEKIYMYINPKDKNIIFNDKHITITTIRELTNYPPDFTVISKKSKIKLYSLKLFMNNEIVRDFVPARDFNDIVCLYDKVSQSFFYNTGTNSLIGGPIKNYLDSQY